MRRVTAITIAAIIAAFAFAGSDSASAGGGCHSDVFTDEATTTVEMSKNCFAPIVARVQPGATVTFTSNDPEAHSVTGVAGTWGDDQEIRNKESVSYQFDAAGVFPYFCFFHPSMVGAVVVGDGVSAAASTAEDSGVSAVSALAPGEAADESEEQAVAESDGRDLTVPLIIGVGVLAAGAGFAGSLVLRRKSGSS